MKFLKYIFVLVGWATTAALGALALYLAMHRAQLISILEMIKDENLRRELQLIFGPGLMTLIWLFLLGSGLLLLAAVTLVLPLRRIKKHRLLEFPTESGRVQVDITALEDCLEHVVSEEEGVLRTKVALRGGIGGGKAPLGCTAIIWFEAGPDIIGKVSAIQSRMRDYYYQVLPIKEPVKIDIRTRLVYQKSGARTIAAMPREDVVTPIDDGASSVSGSTSAGTSGRSSSRIMPGEDYSGPQYPADVPGGTSGDKEDF